MLQGYHQSSVEQVRNTRFSDVLVFGFYASPVRTISSWISVLLPFNLKSGHEIKRNSRLGWGGWFVCWLCLRETTRDGFGPLLIAPRTKIYSLSFSLSTWTCFFNEWKDWSRWSFFLSTRYILYFCSNTTTRGNKLMQCTVFLVDSLV